ncbi:hypothetical protein LIER_28194 [Lithospermum erythrorhizon]|uniref:Uncharacterized protein n=1 Tax=Lithospermum erythrorhizon TaxID=34254 RepID=A0AAV3RIJ9_LITER
MGQPSGNSSLGLCLREPLPLRSAGREWCYTIFALECLGGHSMDENHSLDEDSSPNRYCSLEENHIFVALWKRTTFLTSIDMSSENTQESSLDNPNPSSSQPVLNPTPPQQPNPQVTVIPQEVNQAILGQGCSNDVEDPNPISILPPSNSNPNAPPTESPSAVRSQTGGTPVVSGSVPTVIRDSLPVPLSKESL